MFSRTVCTPPLPIRADGGRRRLRSGASEKRWFVCSRRSPVLPAKKFGSICPPCRNVWRVCIWPLFPRHPTSWARSVPAEDAAQSEDWKTLLAVRTEVLKALEEARQNKLIGGANLEAQVTVTAAEPVLSVLQRYRDQLRFFFIVSAVTLEPAASGNGTGGISGAREQSRWQEMRALLELLHPRGRGSGLSHGL